MFTSAGWLLIGAVAAVGVLHTIVPDHWAPIALIARQRRWTLAQTVRAATTAGVGHVVSTLVIAALVWIAGVVVARQFGGVVDTLASLALIGFGGWIAIGSLMDMRGGGLAHGHSHGHAHDHARGDHEHALGANFSDHDADGDGRHHYHDGEADGHGHHHHDHVARSDGSGSRIALLLILGSSPMVEGIPAFFAASRYGIGLIVVMSLVFGATTMLTYVVLCAASVAGLKRLSLGPIERYGEVLSGAFIALVGVIFWIWPVL